MPKTHLIEPGTDVDLSTFSTKGKTFHSDRKQAEKEFVALRDELIELQNCFYADGRHKLLIVLQATDAGGKDGTIRKVFRGVNPQGCRVNSFKAPSKEELSHDFLWRVHQRVPAAGMIGVFNRSHYEDVLVVRVDQLVPEPVWRQRYEQINHFERLLHETGTTILKFFLHISREEQLERFQARLDDPNKTWKFSRHDLVKRQQWDEYQAAFEEVLTRCSTSYAPWYVIPADQKWYRNLAISRVIVDAIKRIGPKYPEPEVGVEDLSLENL